MKQKFSTAWIGSKRPSKQRKYRAEAPIHLKRKLLSVNLSKELRKKHGMRNIEVIKGDTVKIMRGKFKKKQGKVTLVNTKLLKVFVDGIQVKKQDGSKSNIPIKATKLQIIELELKDKKRFKEKVSEGKPKEETKTKKKTKSENKK